MLLEIKDVFHSFGDRKILHDINLNVRRGQFVALVGPSGCGKSTLLRAVLGTDPPTDGHVIADGDDIIGPSRDVGIVYQQYSLYDFLTVEENVTFGLKLDQTTVPYRLFNPWGWWKLRKQHLRQARELLDEVGLAHVLKSYPSQLSGGMRQRVAIAQALIMKPKILLLDEPFGALDEATREDLQLMLLHLYQENIMAKMNGQKPPHTVVFVTHELNEAFYLADRVVGLSRFWEDRRTGLVGNQVGATICYDKAAPVYGPKEPRDYNRFADLKALLRRAVFDENVVDPHEHVTYWSDLDGGVGTGVTMMAGSER